MDLVAFRAELKDEDPSWLTWRYLVQSKIHAFPTEQEYADFQKTVSSELGGSPPVLVAGSGNWKFSLNPDNNFKEFHADSDIDVVVISLRHFVQSWESLRSFHRDNWLGLTQPLRDKILRNGQNVYSGFVTPLWIPYRQKYPTPPARYELKSILNRLSNSAPGKREVNMLFFRNEIEVHDYYLRGFGIAKKKVFGR